MAPKPRQDDGILLLGVREGEEVSVGDTGWGLILAPPGTVLEVCTAGSSVGFGTEDWFAVLITESTRTEGGSRIVSGKLLGCDNASLERGALETFGTDHIHLCGEDPCTALDEPHWVHVTRVRCWTPRNFTADYLSQEGKRLLGAAAKPAGKRKAAPKAGAGSKKTPLKGAPKSVGKKKKIEAEEEDDRDSAVVSLLSEEEREEEEPGPAGAPDKSKLRRLLRRTKERIVGGRATARPRKEGEDLAGGAGPSYSPSPPAGSKMVAGTSILGDRLLCPSPNWRIQEEERRRNGRSG